MDDANGWAAGELLNPSKSCTYNLKGPILCRHQRHNEPMKQNNTAVNFTSPKTKEESGSASQTGTLYGSMDSEHTVAVATSSVFWAFCSEHFTTLLWRTHLLACYGGQFQRGSFVTEPTGTIEKQIYACAPRTLLSITWTVPQSYRFGSGLCYNVEICHWIQHFQGIQGAIVLERWEDLGAESQSLNLRPTHTVSLWKGGGLISRTDW